MKTVCIYHNNCFDGICAAWVISRLYHNAEFRAFNYSDEFPFNEYGRDDDIIIVDFSFKRDIMLKIQHHCKSILVLDHHKTAQAQCEGLDFCYFDMNESGASLAWKHFSDYDSPSYPPELPTLVRYIKDRDLWLFKEIHSEAINSFIQSFPKTIENYEMLYNMLDHDLGFDRALQGGSSIERYKVTMVNEMCRNVHFGSFPGDAADIIPVVNASMLFSEVGHELCKQFPNAPFAAYYFDRLKDNKRQWGLRSIGDYDVSVIAKQWGGGGHRNAAGFEEDL